MLLKVHPIALGRDQSEKELHIWDPECGLQQFYKGTPAIQCDCQWGAGLVGEDVALILYLFHEERTIEVYFPQHVAVGPNREMNSWDVLFAQQPESLVLVYGETPADRTGWLTINCKTADTLMDSLAAFIDKALTLNRQAESDPVLKELAVYFSELDRVVH